MGPWTVRWPPRSRTASTSAPTPGRRSKRHGVSRVRYAAWSPLGARFAVKESFDAVDAGRPSARRSSRWPATTRASRARGRCPTSRAATSPRSTASRSGCRPGSTCTTPTRCSTRHWSGTPSRGCTRCDVPAPSRRTGGAPTRSGRGVARAGQGGQGRGGAVRGAARDAGPRPARDGGAAHADDRRPVVPPRPVGRQPAGTPDGAACVFDFDNAGPGDPTRELAMVLFEFARTGAERVQRAGGGVRGVRWAGPRHPGRGLRADRSPSCTTSAATRSSAGWTLATPRRGPGPTRASPSSSTTRSCPATSSGCWAGSTRRPRPCG